jgi:hypothetical protein
MFLWQMRESERASRCHKYTHLMGVIMPLLNGGIGTICNYALGWL